MTNLTIATGLDSLRRADNGIVKSAQQSAEAFIIAEKPAADVFIKNGLEKESGIVKKTIGVVTDKFKGLPTWAKAACIVGATALAAIGLNKLAAPKEQPALGTTQG